MKNIYLLFSGQGSQYVGMAANEDHHYLDVASELLQVNIKEMCLQGPLEELTETQFTQPAIVAHSYILTKKILTLIHQKGWHLKAVLGHSVGEYSALVAAGSLDFSQAIQLVHARGKFMQESTQESGTMFAILKCPAQYIEQ